MPKKYVNEQKKIYDNIFGYMILIFTIKVLKHFFFHLFFGVLTFPVKIVEFINESQI
jgi:hypothetical protein